MQCSKDDLDPARLLYNTTTSFVFIFLFFYFSFIILARLFSFLSNLSTFTRAQIGYGMFSDEEEEEDVYKVFEDDNYQTTMKSHEDLQYHETFDSTQVFDDEDGKETSIEDDYDDSPHDEDSIQDPHESDVALAEESSTSPINLELNQNVYTDHDDKNHNDKCDAKTSPEEENKKSGFSGDEKFLIFEPPNLETTKKVKVHHQLPQQNEHENKINEQVFGDSCTVGSTSKSSSEWRSSIFFRDSGTEDPFSSSSRRSCPKWESYTVFQKYDEEMLFLDRISAQKLHETESLKSFQACPRSISDRIVYKLSTLNKKPRDTRRSNPYNDLEGAYVAQICLTWEALNWNYKKFQGVRSSRKGDVDPGCPARVAQQFQQFQVLLLRYIENEPYERGRRPEIYAKMRLLAPKLLQVPEYRDSDDDDDEKKQEGFNSRISSASFLMIMEDGIQTFMNFLKADKGKHCQIIKDFFRRKKRISVDPVLLHIVKKENKKKKLKLRAHSRPRNCLRKRRLNVEEEMEISMSLIDLKVVSRVLRMADLSEEQLHWCEEKMGKVRIQQGKLQRDSTPLFFPAH